MFAEYQKTSPEIVKTILHMAKSQSDHIIDLNREESNRRTAAEHGERTERRIGQFLAFGIAASGFGAAVILGLYDKAAVASIVGGATVIALTTAFIAGRSIESKRRELPESATSDAQVSN